MSRPRLPTLAIERLEDALALLVDNEPDVQVISRFAEKYENPTLLGRGEPGDGPDDEGGAVHAGTPADEAGGRDNRRDK